MSRKVRIEQDVPPIPGTEEIDEQPSGSSFQSTPSGATNPGTDIVGEELAGELIGLPFEAWAAFENRVPKEELILSEDTKAFLAGPVSRIMTKYGLGKIAKDEVIVITTLSVCIFSRTRKVSAAKAIEVKTEIKPE